MVCEFLNFYYALVSEKMSAAKIEAIMNFYDQIEHNDDYSFVHWSEYRKRLSEKKANKFFIGVMLDQGSRTERAWNAAGHFVDNHFLDAENIWQGIARSHHLTLKSICQKGYDGKSYATHFAYNHFPKRLKKAAQKIISEYGSDVRNIWNVKSKDVGVIDDRFLEFDGIGDALSKMAQFTLVRNFGVAGGRENQHLMSIKPDAVVQRVLYRTGLIASENAAVAADTIGEMNLNSPADFDAAVWIIGRDYCLKNDPNCVACPIRASCSPA